MNMEDMKRQAELEYAVREFNNVIESAKASKTDINTSRSIANSIHYMADSDVIVIRSAGVECFIKHPTANQNGWHIAIGLGGNFFVVTPQTILGWLEQIQMKKD